MTHRGPFQPLTFCESVIHEGNQKHEVSSLRRELEQCLHAEERESRPTREACKTRAAKGEMESSSYHLHLTHTARHSRDRVGL